MGKHLILAALLGLTFATSCGDGGNEPSGGGDGDSGGGDGDAATGGIFTDTGGNSTGGSATGSGSGAGTGGAVAAGGDVGLGGDVSSGGSASLGGALGSGGSPTSGGSANSGGNMGSGGVVDTCGDEICEGESARLCPEDCAITSSDFGVDLHLGLLWRFELTSYVQWDVADQHCADLDLLGHSDWRLPTAAEQRGVLGDCNYSGVDYACNVCEKSALCSLWFLGETLSRWSGTESGGNNGLAATISYSTGYQSFGSFKTNAIQARCVRVLTPCDGGMCSDTESCIEDFCVPQLP